LYVDDIILTANTTTLLRSIIASLSYEFSMTDLGDLQHFLGINVHRTSSSMFLSQQHYNLEILDRAKMLHCNPLSTLVDARSKLSAQDGTPLSDPSLYRSLADALQYLTPHLLGHSLHSATDLLIHARTHNSSLLSHQVCLTLSQRHLTFWPPPLSFLFHRSSCLQ
jgi:hypothetical protein